MKLFYTESGKTLIPSILVTIQFASIFYILFDAGFYPTNWMFSIYVIGIFIGLWAIIAMRKAKINITPEVVPGTTIITKGPYQVIRHPMYLAIFLTLFPLIIESFSLTRLLVFVLLILNQIFKIHYEEKKLLKTFEQYSRYKKKTWRIVPFVY